MAFLAKGSTVLDNNGEPKLIAHAGDVQRLETQISTGAGGGWNPAQGTKDIVNDLGDSAGKLTYKGSVVGGSGGGANLPIEIVAFNISRASSGSNFAASGLPTGWNISTSGGSTLLVSHGTGTLVSGGSILSLDIPANGDITAIALDYNSNFRISSLYSGGGYNQAKIENLTANKYRVVLHFTPIGTFA